MRRLMTSLRLARGMHWQRATPTLAELGITRGGVLAAICLVLLLGFLEAHDARVEQQLAASRAEQSFALQQAALLACLNGGSTGLYTMDDGGNRHYIVCGEPFTVSDENVRRPAKG
jgi:hypothetical protein